MVNPKWRLKFNGGNPVWLDETDTIVRKATELEIYEHMSVDGRIYYYNNMSPELKKQVDDLFGNPTEQSV